jgi:hypothetical protein
MPLGRVRDTGPLVCRAPEAARWKQPRDAIQHHTVVPMVVPTGALLAVAGRRSHRVSPCEHDGRR